jgi:hypothetical protein
VRATSHKPTFWCVAACLTAAASWAAQSAQAQVLPPTAQPGFARLGQDLGATSTTLGKDAAVLTLPGHTVTARYKPGPPWFLIAVVPDSPTLRKRVEQALPRYFVRDPWYVPPPPQTPAKPLLARLPDVRTTPRWHTVASTLALLLLAVLGLVLPLRRSRVVQAGARV